MGWRELQHYREIICLVLMTKLKDTVILMHYSIYNKIFLWSVLFYVFLTALPTWQIGILHTKFNEPIKEKIKRLKSIRSTEI